MKKFHDIKPRLKKHKLQNHAELKREEPRDFWHGVGKTEHAKNKKSSRFSYFLLVSTSVVSILIILFGRAYTTQALVSSDVVKSKEHIEKSLALLEEGDFDGALIQGEHAKVLIEKTKLNLQSWGQNSSYLQLVEYDSKYVKAEELLDVVEQLLTLCSDIKNQITESAGGMQSVNLVSDTELNLPLRVDKIKQTTAQISDKIQELDDLVGKLSKDESVLSTGEMSSITNALNRIADGVKVFQEDVIPILDWSSGDGNDRRLMVLFQNNAELRGSGGFIGSYALINSSQGVLKKVDFQTNIYKLDKEAAGKVDIAAPEEFKVLSGGKVYLRDANYAVDGPESLAKVAELYKLESGQSVDGVLTMDTTVVTKLLAVVGPINMPEYGLEVSETNFLTDVQNEVERNYFSREGALIENEPKKILADMMPIFASKVFSALTDANLRSRIIATLSESFVEKHFLLYAQDEEIQDKINLLNAGGRINQNSDYDYFYLHSTNIGGGKSSLNIQEVVKDKISVNSSEDVLHQIEIIRTHIGTGAWPDFNNVNLVRLLLPNQGVSVSDFAPKEGDFTPHMNRYYSKEPLYKLSSEAGKTKMSFWMNTKPSNVSRAGLVYSGKSGVVATEQGMVYRLYIQKQPGTVSANYELEVTVPSGYKVAGTQSNGSVTINFFLDSDKIIEVEMQPS